MPNVNVSPNAVRCPVCGSYESHPTEPRLILIRAFKVHDVGRWWSQCLVCAGHYDKNLVSTPENFDKTKGWF